MSLFVSFEGIDGVGKTANLDLLQDYLCKKGYEVERPREPGGTLVGEEIRQILLSGKDRSLAAETELLLFLAARAQICREVIAPALEAGKVVLCDRFMDSSVAYQGYGRGLDPELVQRLNQFAVGGVVPDLTILLDLPLENARARQGLRETEANNRMDAESDRFMDKVRQGFLTLAAQEPKRIKIIDAAGDLATVQAQIRAEIGRILQ
ncbi:MAG: dTMP kinase [Eubacteriales bacterium]|nr:dTMP kinase [Eubacteriales bacterium]